MREKTRKRLDRLQWRSIVAWMPGLAVAALIIGGFAAFHVSASDERQVSGTVQRANWRHNGDTGQHYPFIEVRLDSGPSVRVGSIVPDLPEVGARITVRERALLFDTMTTYEWDGPMPVRPARLPVATPTPVSHP